MNSIRTLLLSAAAISLYAGIAFAAPDPATGYYQGWDNGSGFAMNWSPNTSVSSVTVENSGGNSGGYLKTSAISTGTFHAGALNNFPLNGDYSGTVWNVSADLKLISGTFDNVWLRYRYLDSGYNGWVHQLTTNTTLGDWFSVTATIDQSWTDAEARANGWIPDNEVLFGAAPPSWSETMASVFTTEIRFSGTGNVEAGIDNFRVSAVQETTPVPEPSTFLLFGAGFGGFAFYRRRMKK